MNKPMNRREFIKKGMAHVAGGIVLTACGGIIPGLGHAQEKKKKIVVDDSNFIATMEELKTNKVIHFDLRGNRSILLYNGGEVRAFRNICTHRNGPNELQGKTLVCQWHGARFDPLTGKAMSKPAPKNSRLPEIPLKFVDDKIYAEKDS